MKLATFHLPGEEPRPGLVERDHVIDICRHVGEMPKSMSSIIAAWDDVRGALAGLRSRPGDHPLSAVILDAPIARPGKILGLGLNYKDHAEEAGLPKPEHQLWFSKAVTTVNAPYGNIQLPKVSDKLDYEVELALVIGQRVKHASREAARRAIFGYCVANDGSVRDWQLRTSQFVVGKSFDTQCPYGPWIVTADEIEDVHNLDIRTMVNGELRQKSSTAEMIYDVCSMVEHLSQAMTLEPGDLILTGTPAGVGAVMKPPRYLKVGDVVRMEIERIGAIENRVVPEE